MKSTFRVLLLLQFLTWELTPITVFPSPIDCNRQRNVTNFTHYSLHRIPPTTSKETTTHLHPPEHVPSFLPPTNFHFLPFLLCLPLYSWPLFHIPINQCPSHSFHHWMNRSTYYNAWAVLFYPYQDLSLYSFVRLKVPPLHLPFNNATKTLTTKFSPPAPPQEDAAHSIISTHTIITMHS